MRYIVVGVDGSPEADRALRWAVHEAELRLAMVEVVHCYVVHARGVLARTTDRELAEARLEEITDRNAAALSRVKWSATTTGVFSVPSVGLVEAGFDAEVIVVGARGGGGFRRLRLGSTGYRVAAHSPTPVAVIPGGDTARDGDDGRRPVVVGIDDSRAAGRALRWAVDEASRRTVELTVVHAYLPPGDPTLLGMVSDDGMQRYLDRARDEAEEVVATALDRVDLPSDLHVEREVVRGTAADALLQHATAEHLLVVGTRGRNSLGRTVFGSVSHQCLHHASGPVVVVA